jgi:hypothetical protein
LASKLIKTWTECIGFRLFSVKLSPTCWFEQTGFHNSVHKFQNLPTSKSQIWHLSTFLLSWTSPNSASNIAKNSSDHDMFAVVQNFSDFLHKLAFFNSNVIPLQTVSTQTNDTLEKPEQSSFYFVTYHPKLYYHMILYLVSKLTSLFTEMSNLKYSQVLGWFSTSFKIWILWWNSYHP